MSRKKPKVVDTVTSSNNGASAPLMLDQDRLEFIGEYGGVTYRHAEATKVRQWLYERLDEQKELSWHPIAQIQTNNYNSSLSDKRPEHDAYFWLGASRFYLGIVPGGGLIMSPWKADRGWEGYWDSNEKGLSESELRYKHSKRFADFELKGGELALPRTGLRVQYSTKSIHYLAYTEELWQGVQELIKATSQLGQRLAELIKSKEGQQQLLTVGQQLVQLQLMAGETKNESVS